MGCSNLREQVRKKSFFIPVAQKEINYHTRKKTILSHKETKQWYFVTKIVLTYCEKKNSSDREKLLKFEVEGQEFAKFWRSLEQFIQTVKVQKNV